MEIARSLVIEPSFLLLDEPFSGIDPIQVLELQRIIFDLKNSGIGILVTDHNVRETLAVTDRAYIINNGKIFRAGTPDALGRDAEVRRVYLGENFNIEFETGRWKYVAEELHRCHSQCNGSRKGSAAQSGRGGGPLQNDSRWRSRGGGAVGRQGFPDAARSALAAGQARAHPVFGLRVHRRAGQVPAPHRAAGRILEARGVDWTYHRDNPSHRLLEEQPDHGCDLCSRFRRRAVYQIARGLGANVIAFGHTADDFCESFLRNAMFTGRVSALPPITYSREKDFRLIRPLAFVTEDITSTFCRIAGRADYPLRLFAADRHGAQVHPQPVR